MNLADRVAARYKGKKTLDTGTVVYEYSDRQVARRNAEKARRLEKLRKGVHRLRAQVKKDLKSGDPERVLTALAVGLMDHTAERVGNEESAKEGHVGVTGWTKSHISFGKGKATISYVGKSGVKQKKTVSDKALLSALKDAYEACDDDIFCHAEGKVDASKVNAYLKKFDITAKDLRGLHANQVMQETLKGLRKGELPSDPKERKAQLKEEFQQALEETAEAVGHEPSTLRSQYLVPDLEDEFMKGRVMTTMTKEAGLAASVEARYIQAAYTNNTLNEIMAGVGMLLAQPVIVSSQFFDEKEIRKYLQLRQSYHETFVEACEDFAEQIESGGFGEGALPAIELLQKVGEVPAKQAQKALRLTAQALRRINPRTLGQVDPRLYRLITMAKRISVGVQNATWDVTDLTGFIKELVKVKEVPAPVRTFLRKALKYFGAASGRLYESVNPGAWFEMSSDQQKELQTALDRLIKERDEVYEKYTDPEERTSRYRYLQERVERIRNAAGVNLEILQKAQGSEPPLDKVLAKEGKLQADGPTAFVLDQIQKLFQRDYSKEGTLPRELGKVLTQLRKARTLETTKRILQEALERKLIAEDLVKAIEDLWGQIGKNLAVRKGVPLTPIEWKPTTAEEFRKKHNSGEVLFDDEVPEKARQELLGKVSRAMEDLESIYGKGFAGKHEKPLRFDFRGSSAFSSASYFAYDEPGNWQPRVKFGDDYEGLLAHELSHFLDDLIANKIDQVKDPDRHDKMKRKFGPISRELFGNTGVSLEYVASQKVYGSDIFPELDEFAQVVLASPDYTRWKNMTGSPHDIGLGKAIEQLTGQSVYDLPKDNPYAQFYWNPPKDKREWPPELLEATEKAYVAYADGDTRKLTYYHSAVEIWARMCEQYVATKLAAAGISNPWLTQLSYDVADLPQMMEQETFEKTVLPVLDRLFERFKTRDMLASRVASRYLASPRVRRGSR